MAKMVWDTIWLDHRENAACAGHGGTPVTLILSSGWGCCFVFVLFLVSWFLSLFFLAWGLVIRLVARMGCAWHWRRKLRRSLPNSRFSVFLNYLSQVLSIMIFGVHAQVSLLKVPLWSRRIEETSKLLKGRGQSDKDHEKQQPKAAF